MDGCSSQSQSQSQSQIRDPWVGSVGLAGESIPQSTHKTPITKITMASVRSGRSHQIHRHTHTKTNQSTPHGTYLRVGERRDLEPHVAEVGLHRLRHALVEQLRVLVQHQVVGVADMLVYVCT